MELKQIKELMAVMQRTGTKRVAIKRDGIEVEIEREEKPYQLMEPAVDLLDENPMKQEMAMHRANMLLSRGGDIQHTIHATPPKAVQQSDTSGVFVTSPMVGTFYGSPSPEDPYFVKVGDRIEKDTVVCIVEAMKVMNEVKAGVAGTVTEILIASGSPVEFGTKLLRITP